MKLSVMRGYILALIKENQPITVTELSKKLNISTGTSIYRYLKELEERKLIVMKKESGSEKMKRGNPTYLQITSKAKPFKVKEFETYFKLRKF